MVLRVLGEGGHLGLTESTLEVTCGVFSCGHGISLGSMDVCSSGWGSELETMRLRWVEHRKTLAVASRASEWPSQPQAVSLLPAFSRREPGGASLWPLGLLPGPVLCPSYDLSPCSGYAPPPGSRTDSYCPSSLGHLRTTWGAYSKDRCLAPLLSIEAASPVIGPVFCIPQGAIFML